MARELMDDDETLGTDAEWRESLRDLARVNLLLGGWNALRAEVARLPRLPERIIDVASGGADMPSRLLDYLAERGVAATCVALDRSARMLRIARSFGISHLSLSFAQGDARQLPYAQGSFDLATMNLALHHFDPPDAVAVLRELARVAASVIVNDLRRSRIAWAFARFVFPLFTRNRFTRNDGPISTLRAYSPGELRELALAAGWKSVTVRKHAGYRMTLVGGF